MKTLSRTASLKRDDKVGKKKTAMTARKRASALADVGKARSGSSKKGKGWMTKRTMVKKGAR